MTSAKGKKPLEQERKTFNYDEGFFVPLGNYLIIKRLAAQDKSKGGIALPSDQKIPQPIGRVMKLSRNFKAAEVWSPNDTNGLPFPGDQIRLLDYVVFDSNGILPIDFEACVRDDLKGTTEDLLLVPADSIRAVWRNGEKMGGENLDD